MIRRSYRRGRSYEEEVRIVIDGRGGRRNRVFAAPASAATLANWQMNEGPGATVMVDSSGHVNGTIGSAVQTGFSFGGATGYHWVFTHPTAPPAKPERIVQANSSTLNPNSGNYTVTLRYRTTSTSGTSSRRARPVRRAGTSRSRTRAGA